MMNVFFKDTRPGMQFLALVLIFVLFLIIGTAVAIIPILVGYSVESLLSQALSQIVTFAGSAVVFAYMFNGRPFSRLGFVKPDNPMARIAGALIVLVLLLPMTDWLSDVNDNWHLPGALAAFEDALRQLGETSEQLMERFLLKGSVGDLFLNLLVMAVVPALCEEMFFRGAMQQTLTLCFRGGHHAAIILTAAIFSLFHGEIFAFLPRFVLGMALGYIYHYGRSIWLNAAAHFLNNAIVVVLYFLAARDVIDLQTAESVGLPYWVCLVTFLIAVVAFWSFFMRVPNNTK